MTKAVQVLKRVTQLRKRYYELSLKKEALLNIIDEAEIAEQVYNSNAIENSTLSLDETEKILLEINLGRYVSARELFEAKNLAKIVAYTNNYAKKRELDLDTILFLHKILLSNINDDVAGRFRKNDEWVRVASHIAADPAIIVQKLEHMFFQYKVSIDENMIKRVARLHLQFEYVHPFIDGNGRIGRVINNYLLIREGYVPINIKFIEREKYYDAFKEFDVNKNTQIMEEIVGKALTNSYHKRLAYLEEKEILTLSAHAKKIHISYSNLLNKANRQTIEAFLEKGVWKIGVQ